ncbi:MAG TPA: hypothetical protein VGJ21_11410 [Terracidiphilus sp.]|jgi:hypothetical protein
MWEWIRRFSSTQTSQGDPALLTLCELAKGQQKLIAQQQETLDRIVAARYDRPLERVTNPPAAEQMPSWGMNDQGDVRPDATAAALGNLGEESDAAWIETASVQ